jgi:hypothetical protein
MDTSSGGVDQPEILEPSIADDLVRDFLTKLMR